MSVSFGFLFLVLFKGCALEMCGHQAVARGDNLMDWKMVSQVPCTWKYRSF
jgi:hypothetical protein